MDSEVFNTVVVYYEGFAGVKMQDQGETEGALGKEQSALQLSDPLNVTMVHEDFDRLQGRVFCMHLSNSSAWKLRGAQKSLLDEMVECIRVC